MKKLLISVVIALLIGLTGITIVKGIEISKLKILGIKEIEQKNIELDEQIQEATKLASTDYQKKIKDLNDSIKELESKKKTYEDMVNVSTEGEISLANQTQDYKIEYLWVQIGTYAKSEGVEMTIEVTRSSSGNQELYDLNFTAMGPYIGIADFITHIEEDSDLGFRIEDFRMISSSDDRLQATFTCKDIKINGISDSTVSKPTGNKTNTINKNTTVENTTVNENNTVE